MQNSSNTNGIGFTGLLQLLFIALKLLGIISWSWLWVLSPTWIGIVIIAIIYSILYILYCSKKKRKKNG